MTIKPLRCAIYTRKSTEYGLEQEFNSLEAQREACEAYTKSQAHEGWRLLPDRYDDGGHSGGSLERPALQQLLEAVRNRRVDVIVVYKVDRLTRSLADFAKLVELFEANQVSFVSVTQSFNTTSSMGRLTLNVLLSFAQLEREVTGERIRDKIAASKKRGMRMGGPVPLGYDVKDKKLVSFDREAEQVRFIFQRYLELGSLRELATDLNEKGIVTKVTRRRDGSIRGGIPFTVGPLAYLLRNRVYIGEVVHHGQHYPGEHSPILDRARFDAVQIRLDTQANAKGAARFNSHAPLAGCIFDDRGNPMLPSSTKKNGARYRYYVSAAQLHGQKDLAGTVARVSAPDVEMAVDKALKLCTSQEVGGSSPEWEPHHQHGHSDGDPDRTRQLRRVTILADAIEVITSSVVDGTEVRPILVPFPRRRPRRQVIEVPGSPAGSPIRAETRARLIEGIARARHWLDALVEGQVSDFAEIAAREKCSERAVRMRLNLAFLSPELVIAAIGGTLPDRTGLSRLVAAPFSWNAQRTLCEEARF